MKKILILLGIMIAFAAAGEFKWARAGFNTDAGQPEEDALGERGDDLIFLNTLEKTTSLKVAKQVDIVYLNNLQQMLKYPFIFVQAQHFVQFTDQEIKNIREYLDRGGFIFQDDCVEQSGKGQDHASSGDNFFQSFKSEIETRVFPNGKMVKLDNNHEIFKSFYKFPNGMPHGQGVPNGGWAYFDETGRMKIFGSSSDVHCGWHNQPYWWGEEKHYNMLKMATNIVIYALSH